MHYILVYMVQVELALMFCGGFFVVMSCKKAVLPSNLSSSLHGVPPSKLHPNRPIWQPDLAGTGKTPVAPNIRGHALLAWLLQRWQRELGCRHILLHASYVCQRY